MNDAQSPEWAPIEPTPGFTSKVKKGVSMAPAEKLRSVRASNLTADELAEAVLTGDRVLLAKAITLVESSRREHQEKARELLTLLTPHAGQSVRIGITGVPGAGKSTLIEALGMELCKQQHKVAILAIDPSSSRSGGSILGDKTRMENLSREPRAFIRPSPSGGTLGGVARKSRETLLLCEAAGFDIVIVETVGVGQSEGIVREMVDFFLLLLLAGAGDELQGMKKGVMELADAVVFNKGDGENLARTKASRAEMERVLHYLQPATEGWKSPALICSALTGTGLNKLWETIARFREETLKQGVFARRRQQQNISWMRSLIEESLKQQFYHSDKVQNALGEIEAKVRNGEMPASAAADSLLSVFMGSPPVYPVARDNADDPEGEDLPRA